MTRSLVLVPVLAALAGCSVGDPYVRPDARPQSAWTTHAAAPAEWPSPDWWRGFGSARLDQLMAQAAQGNFDIQAAMARVRQADAQATIAGAPLLPSLSATGGASRTRSSLAASSSSSASSSGRTLKAAHSTSTNLVLNASYEIDFWGRNSAALGAAEAAAEASRFDSRTVMLTAQSGIATSYFDILGLRERLRVAMDGIANSERVLAVYRDRLAAGTATSLDVAQQESVVANQRATIAPLEQQLRQAHNALAILTGRLPEQVEPVAETLAGLSVPAVAPGLPSELLARRPDVQAAEAALRAANADIAVARAAWFPSIVLTGQGGFQSLDLFKMMSASSLLWQVAASATQPIFEGGRIGGTVEQKRARFDELSQVYRKAVAAAFSDVENALIAVEKTAEEVAAQQAAEATARNAFEIAQSLLAAGTADVTAVLNTQKTLYSAQDALAQARLRRLQAALALYKAMGGGWTGAGGQ